MCFFGSRLAQPLFGLNQAIQDFFMNAGNGLSVFDQASAIAFELIYVTNGATFHEPLPYRAALRTRYVLVILGSTKQHDEHLSSSPIEARRRRAKSSILYPKILEAEASGIQSKLEDKMLTITDGGSLARALKLPMNVLLKRLLIERCDQLGGHLRDVRFLIVQAGDSMKALEQELGWSVFTTTEGHRFGETDYYPGWEWLADHGHSFEMVYIMTDDGFAHVVLIQRSPGVDPELLKLCEMYVTDQV